VDISHGKMSPRLLQGMGWTLSLVGLKFNPDCPFENKSGIVKEIERWEPGSMGIGSVRALVEGSMRHPRMYLGGKMGYYHV
jgi:hypothetical protein